MKIALAQKVTTMEYMIDDRKDYNGVGVRVEAGVLRDEQHIPEYTYTESKRLCNVKTFRRKPP